jgi:hypothetical protein
MHDVQANISARWVKKCLWHSGQDLEAEGLPQLDRRCIGLDHRVELHRPVTVGACLVKDVTAQSPSCADAAAGRVDNESGVGDMGSWTRVVGMSAGGPDNPSVVVDGNNGASGKFTHPAGPRPRLGGRGIPCQSLAGVAYLFQDRPDSGPVIRCCLAYHHAGKHGATARFFRRRDTV